MNSHWAERIFQISQKLFGRKSEIEALVSAYERSRRGAHEFFIISGYAGIGKSSLVNELQIAVTQSNGYFISSRYTLSQDQVPYSALIEALKSLIQQLLSQSEAELQIWRAKMVEVLGENGRIITDIITDVGLILGPQIQTQPLAASEEQNRFNLTLRDFIGAFMSEEHPF